jgi:hypothetical protein
VWNVPGQIDPVAPYLSPRLPGSLRVVCVWPEPVPSGFGQCTTTTHHAAPMPDLTHRRESCRVYACRRVRARRSSRTPARHGGTRPMGQESDSIRFHVSAVDARARVTLPRRHRTVTKLTLNQRPGAARRSQSVSFCYHNTLQPLHTPHLIPAFQLSSSTYPQQLCSYTYIHLEHNHLVASIHKHHCLHRVRLSPVSKRSPRIGGDNVESGYRRLVSRLPPSL